MDDKDQEIIRLREENKKLQTENKWLKEENDGLKRINENLLNGVLVFSDYDQTIKDSYAAVIDAGVDLALFSRSIISSSIDGLTEISAEAAKAITKVSISAGETIHDLSNEIVDKNSQLNNYKKGPQEKSTETQKNRKRVQQYFEQEMEKYPNRSIGKNRRAAAEKAGIKGASDKTLSRYMPYNKK